MNARDFARVVVTATWVSLAISGCATAPAANVASASAPDAPALSAIRDAINRYETALNTNALEDILGLYGSEPVFMPQHAPALIGRDAVRAGYEQVFQTIQLNIKFEIHEVQRAGDWAWARTSSAGRTRILAAGTEHVEGNNELFVFRLENGAWKIHRYLFSTNRPNR